jgi:hypothetical protein
MTRLASAGPEARARLYVIELSPTAVGRSARSTSEASSADAAGTEKAIAMPIPAEITITAGAVAWPAQASAATSAARAAANDWTTMTSRRRSNRSAARPAHGASSSTGLNWEKARTPSSSSDPVSR